VSPILRGMLGLEVDAIHHSVKLEPHLPAEWTRFSMENLRVGKNTVLAANYKKEEAIDNLKIPGGIVLEVGRTSGSEECTFEFRPAISVRAKVVKVDLNGKPIPFQVETRPSDQHVVVQFPVGAGKHVLRIQLRDEFGYSERTELPELGRASSGLRVLSETWSASRDQLTLEVSGKAGEKYGLSVWNGGQIQSVEGASLNLGVESPGAGKENLWLQIPASDSEPYPHLKVVIHFLTTQRRSRTAKR